VREVMDDLVAGDEREPCLDDLPLSTETKSAKD